MKVASHQAIRIQLKIAVIFDLDKLNLVKLLTSLKFTNSKASVKFVTPHPPLNIVTRSLIKEDGWWYREECQMVQKIFTETGMIMRWGLETLQVNYGMDCVPFTA